MIDKEYIIIWYNFQPCSIAGHARIITFGTSLVYQFSLFKSNQNCSLPVFLLSDEPNGLQTLFGFVTGLDIIPSLGFDQSPRLKFHHPNSVDEFDGYA